MEEEVPPADVNPWVIGQVSTSIIFNWPFLTLGVMSVVGTLWAGAIVLGLIAGLVL